MPTQMLKENDVIRVSGELTFDTVMSLWQESRPLLSEAVTVDLSDVTRADSAGVALLCEFKRRQHDVRFQHISQKLQNIIDLSGLTKFFA